MKRTTINFILISLFVLSAAAIVMLFAAEIYFNTAKTLEAGYRWQKAGEKYQAAAHFNPFNAEYFAQAGDFLRRQGECRKGEDKARWLRRAKKLYQRASRLNPAYAEYSYLLGKAELQLTELFPAIEHFQEAIVKDQYNFRNNYLVAYDMFTIWGNLDATEKKFALDRAKFVLEMRPSYANSVYPAILYYAEDFDLAREVTPQTLTGYKKLYSFITQNNLWQYRKQVKDKLDEYDKEQMPDEYKQVEEYSESWTGKSRDGTNEYKDGNIYWEGTAHRTVQLPEGKALITVQARGNQAFDVWPYMVVELDGEEIGETFVDSADWKQYSFAVNTDGGLKVLSVSFVNDGGDWKKGTDRNLYLSGVKVIINE